MPNERAPVRPLASNYVPLGGLSYRVRDGDSWKIVARQFGIDVDALVRFNFNTTVPEEVNWYLRRNVGCRVPTADHDNWTFSSSASPGIIYIPSPTRVMPATTRIVHSVATLSWIDPRLYHPQDLPEVDRRGNPGTDLQRQALLSRQGYRFANFLEGYVVVDDSGQVTDSGFTAASGLNFGPSFRGIMPEAYTTRRTAR